MKEQTATNTKQTMMGNLASNMKAKIGEKKMQIEMRNIK